jgi:hypothetical protein
MYRFMVARSCVCVCVLVCARVCVCVCVVHVCLGLRLRRFDNPPLETSNFFFRIESCSNLRRYSPQITVSLFYLLINKTFVSCIANV